MPAISFNLLYIVNIGLEWLQTRRLKGVHRHIACHSTAIVPGLARKLLLPFVLEHDL